MSYLNLMGNKLKPKDVNEALKGINEALKEINVDDMKSDISDIKSDIADIESHSVEVIDVYSYASGTKPVIATGETIDITTEMYNIISSGKYLLRANLCIDTTNSSAGRTSTYCDTTNQWGVILNRTTPAIAMFRLVVNDEHNKITLTTYGESTFYLSGLKLIKLG